MRARFQSLRPWFGCLWLLASGLSSHASELIEIPSSDSGLPPVGYLRLGSVAANAASSNASGAASRLWSRGGHSGTVTAVAFSNDGAFELSGSGNPLLSDDTMKVWRVADGTLIQTVVQTTEGGPNPAVYQIAVSPNGNCVASGGTGGIINIWTVSYDQGGALKLTFAQRLRSSGFTTSERGTFWPSILGLKFRPDGRSLAGASSGLVSVLPVFVTKGLVDFWDVGEDCAQTWPLNHTVEHGRVAWSVDFDPSSTLAASVADGNNDVKIWDADSGLEDLSVSTDHFPYRVEFSPDGETLAVAVDVGLVESKTLLYSTQDYGPYGELSGARPPFNFSPNSQQLVATGGQYPTSRIDAWDVASQTILSSAQISGNPVASLAIAPSGDYFATGGGQFSQYLKLWQLSDSISEIANFSDFTSFVYTVAISPDGKTVAAAEELTLIDERLPKSVHLFAAADGSRLGTLDGHNRGITAVVFSPTTPELASSSFDMTIRIWNLNTGQARILSGHTSWIAGLDYSADGTMLVSAGGRDQSIRLWDAADGTPIAVALNDSFNWSVAYSPNGNWVATGDGNGAIKLWEGTTLKLINTLAGHQLIRSLAFSADGSLLASGSVDRTISLWSVPEGEPVGVLSGHEGVVNSVAFSPDGTTLVSGSGDRFLIFWDVSSGAELYRVREETGTGVTAVRFSPDASQLLYGREDATVVLIGNPLK